MRAVFYFLLWKRKIYRLYKIMFCPWVFGGVAHMVERSLRMREARGSIPRTSTDVFHFCQSSSGSQFTAIDIFKVSPLIEWLRIHNNPDNQIKTTQATPLLNSSDGSHCSHFISWHFSTAHNSHHSRTWQCTLSKLHSNPFRTHGLSFLILSFQFIPALKASGFREWETRKEMTLNLTSPWLSRFSRPSPHVSVPEISTFKTLTFFVSPTSKSFTTKASENDVARASASKLLDDELLSRVSRARDADEALEMIAERWERSGGVVDTADCCSIISAALDRNNADLALSVFYSMRSSFDQGTVCIRNWFVPPTASKKPSEMLLASFFQNWDEFWTLNCFI